MSFEHALRLWNWFGRVPTHSNAADGPSHLDFHHIVEASVQTHFTNSSGCDMRRTVATCTVCLKRVALVVEGEQQQTLKRSNTNATKVPRLFVYSLIHVQPHVTGRAGRLSFCPVFITVCKTGLTMCMLWPLNLSCFFQNDWADYSVPKAHIVQS